MGIDHYGTSQRVPGLSQVSLQVLWAHRLDVERAALKQEMALQQETGTQLGKSWSSKSMRRN